MAFGSSEILGATPGQVAATPKRVLNKLGIKVLNVRGTTGVRRGRRRGRR